MSGSPPELFAQRVTLNSPEFAEVCTWRFPDDSPFYLSQIHRLINHDIPQRVMVEACQLWVYKDLEVGDGVVGFGTMELSRVHESFCPHDLHFYIPVLLNKPGVKSRGYGGSIVRHLIGTTVPFVREILSAPSPLSVSPDVFLDAYQANAGALSLYVDRCGFEVLNRDHPQPDPAEGGQPYLILKRPALAPFR